MLPPLQFWFTGSALFTIGSFVLFAILGFAGIASMTGAYRRIMYGGYFAAFALFLLGWWQSAQQEYASSLRDADFSVVQKAIKTIADSASISLNQSADQIAAAVIQKIQPLQKQVDTLSRRAADEIYQSGLRLGKVGGISQNEAKTTAAFRLVTTEREIDFSKEIELQDVRLACKSERGPSSIMSFGVSRSITYTDITCKITGTR